MAKKSMTAAQKKAFAERMKKARAAKAKKPAKRKAVKAKTKTKTKKVSAKKRVTTVKRFVAYAQKKSGSKFYWTGSDFDNDFSRSVKFVSLAALKASRVMIEARNVPAGYAVLAEKVTIKSPKT